MVPAHARVAFRIFIALCVIVLGAILARNYFARRANSASVADSLRAEALGVKDLLAHNPAPTQQEVNDAIFSVKSASVAHWWRDASGRPVDPWGTPLSIEFTPGHPELGVTCRSAGPDRQLHTADDIVFTAQ